MFINTTCNATLDDMRSMRLHFLLEEIPTNDINSWGVGSSDSGRSHISSARYNNFCGDSFDRLDSLVVFDVDACDALYETG
jgi:hypothetical protein